uniref:Cryptide Pep-5 n=1 Tax=Tityus obscurus TaxID=1221240 RepID=CRY5_TITOB
KIKEKLIEA